MAPIPVTVTRTHSSCCRGAAPQAKRELDSLVECESIFFGVPGMVCCESSLTTKEAFASQLFEGSLGRAAVFDSISNDAQETDITPGLVGFGFSILIYMFIFMYSVQVMRGVIEEKSNRVIEVIISSVKPFQLMTGKIIGIADLLHISS